MKRRSWAIIVIVLAVAVFYLVYTQSFISANFLIKLTDPANVPVGTTSLTVYYNDIQVHVINGNSSDWINLPGSGTVDLLSLTNSTIVLSGTTLADRVHVDMVRFNVSSTSMTINGTKYRVTVPNNRLTAKVDGFNTFNGSAAVIVDINPTIIPLVRANGTILILIPALSAAMTKETHPPLLFSGSAEPESSEETAALEMVTPNISLSNPVIQSVKNISIVSVTVKDNSNESVEIKHLVVFGLPRTFNSSIDPNSSQEHANRYDTEDERAVENEITQMHTVNFLVSQNGSLVLPSINSDFEGEGFILNATSSITLSFSGSIIMGDNNIVLNFVNGTSYTLVVQGEKGARASVNMTAG